MKTKVRKTAHGKEAGAPFSDEETNYFRTEKSLVDVWFPGQGYFCGHTGKVMKKQIWVNFFNNDPPARLLPKRGEIRRCLHDPQITGTS